jgi:hypothetical protein
VVMVSGELVSSGSELKEVGVVASRNKKVCIHEKGARKKLLV